MAKLRGRNLLARLGPGPGLPMPRRSGPSRRYVPQKAGGPKRPTWHSGRKRKAQDAVKVQGLSPRVDDNRSATAVEDVRLRRAKVEARAAEGHTQLVKPEYAKPESFSDSPARCPIENVGETHLQGPSLRDVQVQCLKEELEEKCIHLQSLQRQLDDKDRQWKDEHEQRQKQEMIQMENAHSAEIQKLKQEHGRVMNQLEQEHGRALSQLKAANIDLSEKLCTAQMNLQWVKALIKDGQDVRQLSM